MISKDHFVLYGLLPVALCVMLWGIFTGNASVRPAPLQSTSAAALPSAVPDTALPPTPPVSDNRRVTCWHQDGRHVDLGDMDQAPTADDRRDAIAGVSMAVWRARCLLWSTGEYNWAGTGVVVVPAPAVKGM
jgi:hypothetical protein